MLRKLILVMIVVGIGAFANVSSVRAQAGQPAEAAAAEPTTAAAPAGDPPAAQPPPTAPSVVPPTATENPDAPAKAAVVDATKPSATPAKSSGAKKGKKEVKEDLTDDQLYPFTDLAPDSFQMPAMMSSKSDHVDVMYKLIFALSVFCFVAITFAVVYLTWRYRHRPGHKAEPSRAHDNVLEVTWTVIPSIICVFIFIGGWRGYLNMSTAPSDAIEINVIGKKWVWDFSYRHGPESLENQNVLHVPVDRPVKLIMRSEDVVHSFYIPGVRTKQDVIPGRYTYLTFEADKPGVYKVYCAEFCGNGHSDMKTRVVVHEAGGYEKWLVDTIEAGKVDCKEDFPDDEEARNACYQSQGEGIYVRFGCVGCHSKDGAGGTGPTFQGMWGQSRSFTDGTSGVVDENYVRESLLDPLAKVRSGFSPVMPTFKGKLQDKDIDALIHWMKGLQ